MTALDMLPTAPSFAGEPSYHALVLPPVPQTAEFTSALCHEEWHVADSRLTIKTSAAAQAAAAAAAAAAGTSPAGMHAAASTASLASMATVSSVASLASLGGSGACQGGAGVLSLALALCRRIVVVCSLLWSLSVLALHDYSCCVTTPALIPAARLLLPAPQTMLTWTCALALHCNSLESPPPC